jgi:hypothetical protein
MKRLALILFICATATMVSAQDYLGFQFGYAQPITRLNTPTAKTTLTPTIYNGFKLGLTYETTIIKGFGVSMGFNYTFGANATDWMKKVSTQPVEYPKVRSKGQYHQLEIPIDWQYKFEIAQETYVILYTGPTLQCGLSFNEQWYLNTGKENGITMTQTEHLYSEVEMQDYALKRINVTWGLGAGFQYDRYFLRGGYDFGMINPYKASQFNVLVDEGHPRTRGRFDQWQIKLGMYLWQF